MQNTHKIYWFGTTQAHSRLHRAFKVFIQSVTYLLFTQMRPRKVSVNVAGLVSVENREKRECVYCYTGGIYFLGDTWTLNKKCNCSDFGAGLDLTFCTLSIEETFMG